MTSTNRLSRREFSMVAAVGTAALCSGTVPRGQVGESTVRRTMLRGGVSLAGGEFGTTQPAFSNANPGIYGKDYIYPNRQTVEYFAECGLGILRIPFRWERLQPELGQPLNSAELGRIQQVVAWAGDCGAVIVLDTHNYGRYKLLINGRPRSVVIDEKLDGTIPVSSSQFADYWRRIAEAFTDNETIFGFGLMNEPHDMGNSNWKAISQHAVDAIRTVDHTTRVIVGGAGWSSAARFPEYNGPEAWINDSADALLYEAHCYFDSDASGQYRRSYAEELRADPQLAQRGIQRIGVFVDWCRQNGVNGFLGEFGIPGESAQWREMLNKTLRWLQTTDLLACYWAAGQWWHDYPLSVQPRDDMSQPAPQLHLLRQWLAAQVQQ